MIQEKRAKIVTLIGELDNGLQEELKEMLGGLYDLKDVSLANLIGEGTEGGIKGSYMDPKGEVLNGARVPGKTLRRKVKEYVGVNRDKVVELMRETAELGRVYERIMDQHEIVYENLYKDAQSKTPAMTAAGKEITKEELATYFADRIGGKTE
jgi:hypothetical protein